MGQYKSSHTGPQIDAGINAALNPDLVPTTGSDALITSDAVAKVQQGFAPIETAATAANSYSIGDLLVWGGVLYKAKTSITAGDSFVVDTNVEATTIADKLNNIDTEITSNTDTTLTGLLTGNGSKVGTKSLDTSSLTNDADHVPVSSVVKSALTSLASDLASIHATGSTNTTGATITKWTYFYLDGVLVQAKVDIASGATFTLNTNYEVPTAGALNALKNALTSSQTTEWKQVTRGMSASASVVIDLSQYNKIAIEVRQTYGSTHYYGSYMLPVSLVATEENRFAFDVVTSWQMGAQYNANTRTLYIYSIQNPPDYSPYWRAFAFN